MSVMVVVWFVAAAADYPAVVTVRMAHYYSGVETFAPVHLVQVLRRTEVFLE